MLWLNSLTSVYLFLYIYVSLSLVAHIMLQSQNGFGTVGMMDRRNPSIMTLGASGRAHIDINGSPHVVSVMDTGIEASNRFMK